MALSTSAPVFRDADGTEHALGPLERALVLAVLGVAARMRRAPSYQAWLHVKRGSVVVQVVQHVGNVAYTCGGESNGMTD